MDEGGFRTLLFRCAVCERDIRDWPHRRGPDRELAPVCRYCGREWCRGVGKIKEGTFVDRRKAMQINVLADALGNKASIMKWETKYAKA